eukprot:2599115-Prymnesium_polylepis.1
MHHEYRATHVAATIPRHAPLRRQARLEALPSSRPMQPRPPPPQPPCVCSNCTAGGARTHAAAGLTHFAS